MRIDRVKFAVALARADLTVNQLAAILDNDIIISAGGRLSIWGSGMKQIDRLLIKAKKISIEWGEDAMRCFLPYGRTSNSGKLKS